MKNENSEMNRQKNQFFATAIVACLAIALIAPSISPAGSTKKGGQSGQSSPPKKGKKAPSPAPAQQAPTLLPSAPPASAAPSTGNLIRRAPSLVSQGRIARNLMAPAAAQIADQEVCLFQNANYGGWKFCTNLKGLQALPARNIGQATSLKVPDGYLLRLYQRENRSGRTCVFYGQVGQVSRGCDNMTAAISFEADPEWPAKQAAAQTQRELEEARAALQRERAESEADAARAVAFQQEQSEIASARETKAREDVERREAARIALAEAELELANRRLEIIREHNCLVGLSNDDGDFNPLNPMAIPRALLANSRCANEDRVDHVGSYWNEDIETVWIKSPYVKFTAYEHPNLQGRSVTLLCGTYELIDEPENEISSYKIEILDQPAACRANSNANIYKWDR